MKPGLEQFRGFAVHVLTASGAALAFLAAIMAAVGAWSAMFLGLGLALVVDALDGPLARRFEVAKTLPRWSGDALDLVVDFLSYVFVPAFALTMSGLIPLMPAVLCGVVIIVTGAIYFADREMKTRDNYFRGFPALWNVVVFYIFLLVPPVWASIVAVVVLAGLSFAPIAFVHPLRVERWRPITLGILALWAVLALVALYDDLAPDPWVVIGLCLIAIYVVAIGLLRVPPPARKKRLRAAKP
jgi:phosphatidylcholine synthase